MDNKHYHGLRECTETHLRTDWDQVIADRVADKVLSVIGNQMRMPEPMVEHILGMIKWSGGSQMVYHHLLGYGPVSMAVEYTIRENHITAVFFGTNGERIGVWTFHV